jgi:Uma2 family endonuclease
MTVAPWPDHLLTLEEWDDLPEDEHGRSELVDGVLVVTPSATPDHQTVAFELGVQLRSVLKPHGLGIVLDIDVVLVAGFPPLVRRPDLVVVARDVLRRRPKRFAANDLTVAVEIVSPGSKRTDRITKVVDYAEAGIPHYWIVDIEEPITLEAFTLVDGAYEKIADVSAPQLVELTEPVPVTIDLGALLA